MMGLLLVLAVVFVLRLIFRKREPETGMQYAGAGAPNFNPQPARFDSPSAAAGSAASATTTGTVPPGFDVEGFLRQAKLNFIRLQAANDRGDMDDVRQFTAPELFAEIRMQYQERGGKAQETDVMQLEAEVLEVVSDGANHVASVRFFGTLREDGGAPESFAEVWHLAKPVDGSRGWTVAGIQQA